VSNAKDIVLAFSGGLDTSFCVPWLVERGWRVTTLFVDTGGVSPARREEIERRAVELGAHRHVTQDAADELWSDIVVPMIRAGRAYQDQYPLLCSDRYLIARRMIELARDIGATAVAHGCTAMGNDQVRFDLSLQTLADLRIVAPIRELQSVAGAVREHEAAYLRERGIDVELKTSRYTINENLLGVTVSGAEIDRFEAPGPETWCLTAPPDRRPSEPARATIGFAEGAPVMLDGAATGGPAMLGELTRRFGPQGVGRGIYTGDTTIGLKGRIVFECPALAVLLHAHRALEETVLTRAQNAFKPLAARQWVQLVYEGLFFEPLREDIEAFVRSPQRPVTGEVTVEAHGPDCHAVTVRSAAMACRAGATYAQSSDWTGEQAVGFIQLFGQSTTIASRVRAGMAPARAEPEPCTA
jgi:argininosuccinate synthase